MNSVSLQSALRGHRLDFRSSCCGSTALRVNNHTNLAPIVQRPAGFRFAVGEPFPVLKHFRLQALRRHFPAVDWGAEPAPKYAVVVVTSTRHPLVRDFTSSAIRRARCEVLLSIVAIIIHKGNSRTAVCG